MDFQIVKVNSNEQKRQFDAMPIYGYYPSPDVSNENVIQKGRKLSDALSHQEYIVYLNNQPVSSAASVELRQNVRNKIYPMGGILNVNTYPENRRKGLVTELMIHLFAEMKEKGHVFSTLYPF